MHSPDEDKIYFTKNWQIENEQFRDTRSRGIHEMEDMKRTQEFGIREFSTEKLIENQSTIKELMAKEQELQNS